MRVVSERVRAPRSDARQNRARILEAARDILGDEQDLTMHAVAKRAGVGQATLYRNFPDINSLVLALHHAELIALSRQADTSLQQASPRSTLQRWLEQLRAIGRPTTALGRAFVTLSDEQVQSNAGKLFDDQINALVAACHAAGEIRPDVSGRDVMVLVGFMWRPVDGKDDDARASRLLGILLDGLAP